MIKILVVMCNREKTLRLLFQKYNLSYKLITYGNGTANNGILEYLGITKTKKEIYLTLIPSVIEKNILNDIKRWFNIEQKGKGIAWTMHINSSSKFIKDNIDKGEFKMHIKCDYELIITIVQEGFSEYVMKSARSVGCLGGTVINGRSLGSRGTIFKDLSVEPEKEVVLNIVKKDIKKDVMNEITKDCGIKTDAHGVVMSIPLDSVVGLQE